MGLQAVRITQEVAYNTYPSSPATGTFTDIFLPVDDAMSVRPTPQFWQINDASQGNRPIRRNVGRTNITGTLQTYLFPSQAGLLMGLATTLTGTAPCLDLNSFTIDHAIFRDGNCAVDYRRYTGCKFGNVTLTADNTDQGCLLMFKGDVIASTPRVITVTDFPTPALSAYPADDPFLFYQTSSHFTIGTVRTNYQSLSLSVANVLKSFMDESIYVSSVDWFGRTTNLSAKLKYKAFTDRSNYEIGTKQAASVKFDNGTHSVLFDLGGQAIFDAVSDSLPLADYFTQSISMTSLVDPSLGTPTDLTVTVA